MAVRVPDPTLRFSVVVPSRGEEARLLALLEALARQTIARERYEVIVALDGGVASPVLVTRLDAMGATLVRLERRSGPGAARNAGAARAHADFLAFTEDDVTPAADWLERAAARLDAEPALDVLEGATLKPGGRPVRVLGDGSRSWLPTNLFVRRSLFSRVGGYCEGFFDLERAVYFREDSDFGFTLEEAGARLGMAPEARVTHPEEHPGFLDPLRWARRYEMDALLAQRHPRLFRERIEVHRLGPLRIRRPVVRASWLCVLAFLGAGVAPLLGRRALAVPLLILAAAAFLPVWAKWRFSPLRLPVVLAVPFVLVGSLARGWVRVRAGVMR
jgi:glycosyltransferase involved in cell wall biosynthesis